MLEQKGIGMSRANKTRSRSKDRAKKKRNPNNPEKTLYYYSSKNSYYLDKLMEVATEVTLDFLSKPTNWKIPPENIIKSLQDIVIKIYKERFN